MNRHQINSAFGPQGTLQDYQVERLRRLQQEFKALAYVIIENTPTVPDQERALDLLEKAYTAAQSAARKPRSIASPDVVQLSFRDIEGRDDRVVRVWLNAVDFADVRKYGQVVFDPTTKAEDFRRGFQGKLWNTEVWIKRSIPEGYSLPIGSGDGDADLDPEWIPDQTKLVRL